MSADEFPQRLIGEVAFREDLRLPTPLPPGVSWLALTGGSRVHPDTRGWDVCRSAARVCHLQRRATTALWPPVTVLAVLLVSFCRRCFWSLINFLCPLVGIELLLLKNLHPFIFEVL